MVAVRGVGNGEIADGALRVDAPIGVGWHGKLADAVMFDAEAGNGVGFRGFRIICDVGRFVHVVHTTIMAYYRAKRHARRRLFPFLRGGSAPLELAPYVGGF